MLLNYPAIKIREVDLNNKVIMYIVADNPIFSQINHYIKLKRMSKMNGLEILYEIIFIMIYLVMTAIIIRTITIKRNLDDSYKTTIITVLIWGGLSIILSIIVIYLIFNKLFIHMASNIIDLFLMPIILLTISFSIGILIIKKIYKIQIPESINILIEVTILQFLITFGFILYYFFVLIS